MKQHLYYIVLFSIKFYLRLKKQQKLCHHKIEFKGNP
jgi:hypothetical protein